MGKKLLQAKQDEILKLSWEDEDKKMLSEMLSSAIYYHRLIPKNMINDVIRCIDLCIKEKLRLDEFREKCTCAHLDSCVETLAIVGPETSESSGTDP